RCWLPDHCPCQRISRCNSLSLIPDVIFGRLPACGRASPYIPQSSFILLQYRYHLLDMMPLRWSNMLCSAFGGSDPALAALKPDTYIRRYCNVIFQLGGHVFFCINHTIERSTLGGQAPATSALHVTGPDVCLGAGTG